MAKADVVAKGVQDFQTAIQTLLGNFYDEAVADQPAAASAGVSAGQEQTDIAAAVAPLNQQIASLQSAAQGASDQIEKLQAQIAADAADEATAQAAIQQVQQLKTQLASLDSIVQSVIGQFAPAASASAPVSGSGAAAASGTASGSASADGSASAAPAASTPAQS